MKRTNAIISAALLSVGAVAAPAVYAQAASSTASSAASSASQNFSDAQLKSFANATQHVVSLSQDYTKQLQAAGKDTTKVAQIRREANTKMVDAVKKSGLSVSKFNQIGQSIEQNPQLLKRVQGMVHPAK